MKRHIVCIVFALVFSMIMCCGSVLSFSNRNIPFTSIDIPIFSLGMSTYAVTLKEGKSADLSVTQFGDTMATWTSSDTSVATVDRTGKVTAVKEGTCQIEVQAGPKTMYVTITVPHTMTAEEKEYEEMMDSVENPNVYWKLAKGEDITILVLGDSVSKGTGADDGKSFVERLQKYIEKTYNNKCTVDNLSLSGTTYTGIVSAGVRNNYDDYDLCILCYGENDKFKTLSSHYESLIRKVQTLYPKCEIISVIETMLEETPSKISVIKNLCSYYSIPYADVVTAFNKSGKSDSQLFTKSDHPSNTGHKIYYQTIKKIIEERIANQQFEVTSAPSSTMNSDANKFDKLKYYSSDQMTRVNDYTYKFKAPMSGNVGLDLTYTVNPRAFSVTYWIGSKKLGPYSHYAKATTKKDNRHMWSVTRGNCTKGQTITVTFGSKAAADKFYGIIIASS